MSSEFLFKNRGRGGTTNQGKHTKGLAAPIIGKIALYDLHVAKESRKVIICRVHVHVQLEHADEQGLAEAGWSDKEGVLGTAKDGAEGSGVVRVKSVLPANAAKPRFPKWVESDGWFDCRGGPTCCSTCAAREVSGITLRDCPFTSTLSPPVPARGATGMASESAILRPATL